MKEIVIISGKGGTGKTSITASFAALANGKAVFADCDVDAADLHLIMKPAIIERNGFKSGHTATVMQKVCIRCGKCIQYCRFGAVHKNPLNLQYTIDPVACEGCGVCVRFCPVKAIEFTEEICGEWFISDTRFGKLVHAKLGIAAENSGKLVTLVRNEAKKLAQNQGAEFVIIDGSPGIGCPVIASLTAADLALIVTEPTVSGDHDLRRIVKLTRQLGVETMICVNKWDINPAATEKIINFAISQTIEVTGTIRYDKAFSDAQRLQKAIPEYSSKDVYMDVCQIWNVVKAKLLV